MKFEETLEKNKTELPFSIKIMVKTLIGMFFVFVVTFTLLFISELYYRYDWNWFEIFIIIVILIGFCFGSYLIGTIIWFLIPKLLKFLRQRGDR